MFEKTNPPTTGWMTWTFDPLIPETPPSGPPPTANEGTAKPAATRPAPPTPLQFAMVILPVLRRFPEAYQAVTEAIRRQWPLLAPT